VPITQPSDAQEDGSLVADLLDLLDHEDAIVQQHAICALPGLAEGDAPEALAVGLLERARDPARAPDGRDAYAALYAALFASQRPHDALLAALASDAEHERIVAARALGWRGNDQAVDALVRSLDGEPPAVQAAAAEALGEIGGQRAEAALIALLETEPASRLREAAVRGIRGASGEAAEAAVIAQLKAGAGPRLAALACLRGFDALRSTAPVRRCLTDTDPRVRLLALSVLELHGGESQDLAAVRELCADDDPRVQRMARETTRALGG
jgi:HEAT repeat protein